MDKTLLAKSFETIGTDYDRYRPGFPGAAADLLVPGHVGAVLDLGAGTGKFTELLVGLANRVVAVEPSLPMLDVLRAKLPGVEAMVGGAEAIPLPDHTMDAVAVAQAFHWFDRQAACAEISRVLVPGGRLGLLWNRGNPDCTWDRACAAVVHPAVTGQSDATAESASHELPGFQLLEHREVPCVEPIRRADYIARWQTVSSFLVADQPARADMLAQLDHILDADPGTAGRDVLEMPHVTDVYVYRAG
ncbi:class I SAM-dependent methyltransferase [Tessaracoccus terricola]